MATPNKKQEMRFTTINLNPKEVKKMKDRSFKYIRYELVVVSAKMDGDTGELWFKWPKFFAATDGDDGTAVLAAGIMTFEVSGRVAVLKGTDIHYYDASEDQWKPFPLIDEVKIVYRHG